MWFMIWLKKTPPPHPKPSMRRPKGLLCPARWLLHSSLPRNYPVGALQSGEGRRDGRHSWKRRRGKQVSIGWWLGAPLAGRTAEPLSNLWFAEGMGFSPTAAAPPVRPEDPLGMELGRRGERPGLGSRLWGGGFPPYGTLPSGRRARWIPRAAPTLRKPARRPGGATPRGLSAPPPGHVITAGGPPGSNSATRSVSFLPAAVPSFSSVPIPLSSPTSSSTSQ